MVKRVYLFFGNSNIINILNEKFENQNIYKNSFSNSTSLKILTPNFSAFSNLLPAFSPAIRKSRFFETPER